MEPNTKLIILTFVFALTLTAATGQSLCGMTFAGLNSCKPYVRAKNPLTTTIDPLSPCCTALSKADFQCLCTHKDSIYVRDIDFHLAEKLPEKCGLPAATC